MYWCKPVYGFLAMIVLMSGLLSCKPDMNAAKDDHAFFSLKKYFSGDSARMAQKNPWVNKTVAHNTDTQTRKIHIADWGTELSVFAQSDINRPAWKADYQVVHSDSITMYTAVNPDLRTRQIIIKQTNGKVQYIRIYNHTKNFLYETKEFLSYFPDSLYRISRWQHVKLLGTNTYKITGQITPASK